MLVFWEKRALFRRPEPVVRSSTLARLVYGVDNAEMGGLARQPSGNADNQAEVAMDSREHPTQGSTSTQQNDSDTESLFALVAACKEQEADAMRRHAMLGSDPSLKAVRARIRCLREAITCRDKRIRLLQRAGLLPRLRRRRRSNSR